MADSFLLLSNIAKNNNLGALIRTANAFGVHEIVVTGRRRFSTFGNFGTRGASRIQRFARFVEGVDYVRSRGATVFGIEISERAISVENRPFEGSAAFVPGNEGDGLRDEQIALCDELIYIRQFGTAPSINVNAATAIVLHHFSLWAGYEECERRENKFLPLSARNEP